MAGRLYRMAKVVSANPASWGIVDANQISGFRTVATQADLYSIAACILSSSYGDGTTTGADAVGQIWHVQDTNKDFRLTSWASRGTSAGWKEVLYADSVYSKSEIDGKISTINKNINTVGNAADAASVAASAAQTTANAAKSQAETANGKAAKNSELITGLQNTVNHVNTTVSDHTTSIDSINATLKKKADLDNKGFVPLSQLGNLDMTVFTVVSVLPTSNIENKVYLLSNGSTGDNKYEEYIYTGDRSGTYDASKWERLGSVKASVDMTNYYTKKQTDDAIDDHRVDTIKFVGEQVAGSTNLQLGLMEKAGSTTIGPVTIPAVTSSLNGLMSPTMLTKLNGIATGANNYVHPTRFDGSITTAKMYRFSTDKFGHIGTAIPVSKEDITGLGIPGELPALKMSTNKTAESVDVCTTYGGNDYTASIPSADANNAGVMSVAAWTKLNGIAEGATNNAVVNKVESTSTDAVSSKAVYTAINTHKINNNNLSSTNAGNTYYLLGQNDSEANEVGALVDTLTYRYDAADHSTLSIDGAAVWDEVTLTAISNDKLTSILV